MIDSERENDKLWKLYYHTVAGGFAHSIAQSEASEQAPPQSVSVCMYLNMCLLPVSSIIYNGKPRYSHMFTNTGKTRETRRRRQFVTDRTAAHCQVRAACRLRCRTRIHVTARSLHSAIHLRCSGYVCRWVACRNQGGGHGPDSFS